MAGKHARAGPEFTLNLIKATPRYQPGDIHLDVSINLFLFANNCEIQNADIPFYEERLQKSNDKMCSICMEDILEKEDSMNLFGIIEFCEHSFCYVCIYKWAVQKGPLRDNTCPLCRKLIDLVIPTKIWIENKMEKEKLRTDYCKLYNIKFEYAVSKELEEYIKTLTN